MNALIYYGIRDVRLEERPVPECGPEDVIVRIMRAGICGSDVTAYLHGGRNMNILEGREFGHEMVGYVCKIGERVRDIAEGDRVFVEPVHTAATPMEANMAGGFSQYVKVPHAAWEKNLYRLPDSLSYDDAVLTEPLSVSTHGKNRAAVKPEEKVLIFGSGPIGLGVAAALLAQGNTCVAIVDKDPHRLSCAERMGIHPIWSTSNDLENLKNQLEQYFGTVENVNHRVIFGEDNQVQVCENPVLDVDAVFDCAGNAAFVDEFIRHAKQYSRLCDIAVHRAVTPVRFHELMSTQCALMGSRGYEHDDIMEAIGNLAVGKVNVPQMISHCFPLSRAPEAFAVAADPAQSVKVILDME